MGNQTTFHAPGSGADFLGWRVSRTGSTEIVYESGLAQRIVWRVSSGPSDEADLAAALKVAVSSNRVVPTLIDELKKRAIDVERMLF
ncbi:MAG: hypothetical protein ABI832_01565 [bacterium]